MDGTYTLNETPEAMIADSDRYTDGPRSCSWVETIWLPMKSHVKL
jgi:hypothetical protein